MSSDPADEYLDAFPEYAFPAEDERGSCSEPPDLEGRIAAGDLNRADGEAGAARRGSAPITQQVVSYEAWIELERRWKAAPLPERLLPCPPNEALQSEVEMMIWTIRTLGDGERLLTQALEQHIPRMVPGALLQKATALAHEATRYRQWSAVRRLADRPPAIHNLAQLREWIAFLRDTGSLTSVLACQYALYLPPRPSALRSGVVRPRLWGEHLIAAAWPLLRGEWGVSDQALYLSAVADLYVDGPRPFCDTACADFISKIWDVIRATSGTLRPPVPRWVRTYLDFQHALDVAVLWCDQEEARATRQSRCQQALAGPVEEKPPASPPTDDESAYRPAHEFQDTQFPNYKAITKALEENPTIRRRRPCSQKTGRPIPNRLSIHAGDWKAFLAKLKRGACDPLDLPAHLVDATVQEVARRKAEVDQNRVAD